MNFTNLAMTIRYDAGIAWKNNGRRPSTGKSWGADFGKHEGWVRHPLRRLIWNRSRHPPAPVLREGHVRRKDGVITLLDAPGLSLELNEEFTRRHRVA